MCFGSCDWNEFKLNLFTFIFLYIRKWITIELENDDAYIYRKTNDVFINFPICIHLMRCKSILVNRSAPLWQPTQIIINAKPLAMCVYSMFIRKFMVFLLQCYLDRRQFVSVHTEQQQQPQQQTTDTFHLEILFIHTQPNTTQHNLFMHAVHSGKSFHIHQ